LFAFRRPLRRHAANDSRDNFTARRTHHVLAS
jgi:hypothetical protein